MITIQQVRPQEDALLHGLASQCPPLDLHTPYTYWVLSNYMTGHCFLAWEEEQPVGFITGVSNRDTGFVWQIGILPGYRGRGISRLLIEALLGSFLALGLTQAQVTIDETNANSYNAFTHCCARLGYGFAPVDVAQVVDGGQVHKEIRYQITMG